MSYVNADQIITAQSTNMNMMFGLTNKAFEGVEKFVELNLQVARAALSEAAETVQAALAVKDAQELIALQTSLVQPAAEKAVAYGRHVYEIATSTSAEISKVAEAGAADVQAKMIAAVDSAVKNAPAGSENVIALVKSSVAAANNAFDGMQKAVKQASDVAESNFQAISASASKVTQSATRAKRSV